MGSPCHSTRCSSTNTVLLIQNFICSSGCCKHIEDGLFCLIYFFFYNRLVWFLELILRSFIYHSFFYWGKEYVIHLCLLSFSSNNPRDVIDMTFSVEHDSFGVIEMSNFAVTEDSKKEFVKHCHCFMQVSFCTVLV